MTEDAMAASSDKRSCVMLVIDKACCSDTIQHSPKDSNTTASKDRGLFKDDMVSNLLCKSILPPFRGVSIVSVSVVSIPTTR
eukprot:scaffold12050_cov168-Amphora_coffeaeformis.AAC.6